MSSFLFPLGKTGDFWGTMNFIPLFLFLAFSSWVISFAQIPGGIPLSVVSRPSSDLVYQGKVLLAEEAHLLREQGVDLSQLDPIETSDLWKNRLGQSLAENQLPVQDGAILNYVSPVASRLGQFRFTVTQVNESGQRESYIVVLSKSPYEFLLRKALLEKIGYFVPPVERRKQLQIQFRGTFSRNQFVKDIRSRVVADPARWLAEADSEKLGSSLIMNLQDVLLMPSQVSVYNLATGFLPAEVIQGRRLLNSLLVAYGLLDVESTIQGMSWKAGRVSQNHVLLPIESAEEFSTSREDAVWILRRISKLARADWQQIVACTELPTAVQILLTEKLISRTSSLLNLFGLPSEHLRYDAFINYGEELQNGQLLRTSYPGYAGLFRAEKQPSSPLTKTEVRAFLRSQALSGVLESLVKAFDSAVLSGTDIEKRVVSRQIEAAENQFWDYIETGKMKEIPVSTFAFPIVDGGVAVSRDIIFGSYLGADNMIQLADSVDISASAGIFASAVGLPTKVQPFLTAQFEFSKTFTHLKPVTSIKKALEEPFKNILAQRLMKEKGGLLSGLDQLPEDETERNARLAELAKALNESLGVGESLIISTDLGPSFAAGLSYRVSSIAQAQLAAFRQKISIERLHIYKSAPHVIQIYRDEGDLKLYGVSASLEAYIPILVFQKVNSHGVAATEFFRLNIQPDLKLNPDLQDHLSAARELLLHGNTEILDQLQKPIKVQHNFSQNSSDFRILFFESSKIRTNDRVRVTDREDRSRDFYYSSRGRRTGDNFQGLTIDIVNALLEEKVGENLNLPNRGSGDPGDSFKGESISRETMAEVEIKKQMSSERGSQAASPFVQISYSQKGWRANQKKIKELLTFSEQKFGSNFFDTRDFIHLKEIDLYSLDVQIFVYEDGIRHLLSHSEEDFQKWIQDNLRMPKISRRPSESHLTYLDRVKDYERRINGRLMRQFRELKRADQTELPIWVSNLRDLLSDIESMSDFKNFQSFIGGIQNLYVQGILMGFRDGEENGDRPILSHSRGEVGSERPRGNLLALQREIGMTQSEFFAFWLMRRL